MKLQINMQENCVALSLKWAVVPEDKRAMLYDKAQDYLRLHYGELRIGDFFDCMNAEYGVIMHGKKDWNKCNNAQFLWAMGFAEYLRAFSKMIQRLQVPMSAEEKAAQGACLAVSFEESVLVFVQQYFGLPSFKACQEVTINEYLIAKKQMYNRAIVQQKVDEQYKNRRSKR